jgi:Uma2 family endonuclease
MVIEPRARATLEGLTREPAKAELIGGSIVRLAPTGRKPNRVAGRIYRSLDDYAERSGRGEAFTDNMGFTLPVLPSGRQSFAPDAASYAGPLPADAMRFIEGPPTLAVEVRSQTDQGTAAEEAMAAKRRDYCAAGTAVVWDVDPAAERIHVYRTDSVQPAATYARGQLAEAEPAAPGWRVAVDWIFS